MVGVWDVGWGVGVGGEGRGGEERRSEEEEGEGSSNRQFRRQFTPSSFEN